MKGPLGESLTLFFKVREIPAEAAPVDGIVGVMDMTGDDGRASVSLSEGLPEALAEFLLAHISNHTVQNLARR